jgi:DNA transformation protein and related proteins
MVDSRRPSIRRPAQASSTPADVAHFTELLASAGPVRARRMFGGWGFYVDGLFVALASDTRLYLKVNLQSQTRFEAAGCEPFVYRSEHKTVQMAYYTAPDDALDSPAAMQPWVQMAVAAAVAARAAKPKSKPRSKPQGKTTRPA